MYNKNYLLTSKKCNTKNKPVSEFHLSIGFSMFPHGTSYKYPCITSHLRGQKCGTSWASCSVCHNAKIQGSIKPCSPLKFQTLFRLHVLLLKFNSLQENTEVSIFSPAVGQETPATPWGHPEVPALCPAPSLATWQFACPQASRRAFLWHFTCFKSSHLIRLGPLTIIFPLWWTQGQLISSLIMNHQL